MKKTVKPEYIAQARLLAKEEAERLLSRMGDKLNRRIAKQKVSQEQALAMQLELEDEQLEKWRKTTNALKKKEAAKRDEKAKSAEKAKVAVKAKAPLRTKVAAKAPIKTRTVVKTPVKPPVKTKVAAKPKAPLKAKVDPGR